jgi:hypothetical protein
MNNMSLSGSSAEPIETTNTSATHSPLLPAIRSAVRTSCLATTRDATQAIASPLPTSPWGLPASGSPEPFEHRYLDALSEEGLDLPSFLDSWRRAMDDDLARLGVLCRERDRGRLRSMLHRLSGAVGLVGACSLMEALRRASTSPDEPNTRSVDALIERAANLMTQLNALAIARRGPGS